MKKNIKVVLTVVLTLIVSLFAFTSCDNFDGEKFAEESLNYYCKGEVGDYLIEKTGKTKDQLTEEYEQYLDEITEDAIKELGQGEDISDEAKAAMKEAISALLPSLKYEITGAGKTDDGKLFANVKFTYLDCLDSFTKLTESDKFAEECANLQVEGNVETKVLLKLAEWFKKQPEEAKYVDVPNEMSIDIQYDSEKDCYSLPEEDRESLWWVSTGIISDEESDSGDENAE